MPTKSPVEDEVVAAIGRLLRRGLPISPATADPVLLDLRGIVDRAVDPADEASRTAALDGTLRGLLARFPDTRYAPAARTLFGLPPAQPGQNLTSRRDLAAEQAGHELHHFRKRVEPRLIEKVAWELASRVNSVRTVVSASLVHGTFDTPSPRTRETRRREGVVPQVAVLAES
jgi:hypothetical protein